MEKTKIFKHYKYNYCVMVPVYYQYETEPAWRYYATGSRAECEQALKSAPEYLKATAEEEATARHWKRLEMLFLYDHGRTKDADKIKAQYHF